MASYAQACCCEGGSDIDCPGSCNHAASYQVTQITGSYRFQSYVSDYSGCGQDCLFVEHDLQLNWVQLAPITVTKVSNPASTKCCYQGSGTMIVTGSLLVNQIHTGGPSPCQDPYVQTDTFNFEHDVPFTITVTCTGPVPGCTRTPTTSRAWNHTLHICDFPIACSFEKVDGDCDTCPTSTALSLRCGGGTVSYITDLGALPAVDQDSGCLGYWQPGLLCNGNAPYPAMAANAGAYGPFAIFLDGECSEQDPQDPCTLSVQTQCFLPHDADCDLLVSPWLCPLRADLRSYCGGTDWSGGPAPDCRFDVLQSGCTTMPWRYA